MERKAPALLMRWNKDLSISVYKASGGARLTLVKKSWIAIYKDHKEAVEAICQGWFGTEDTSQWRVRWEYV